MGIEDILNPKSDDVESFDYVEESKHIPEGITESLEGEKKINKKNIQIDTGSDTKILGVELPGGIEKNGNKISDDNHDLKKTLNTKEGYISSDIYTDFRKNIDSIKKDNNSSTKKTQKQLLEEAGNIFTNEKDNKLVDNKLPVYVTFSSSYEKSYIDNKGLSFKNNLNTNKSSNESIYGMNLKNFSKEKFQGTYMKEIENLIKNGDGTMNSLIDGLNKKKYTEADLLKTMSALSAESFIRAYDNDFYENGDYNSAKNVLSQESDGDLLIGNLKKSIKTGKHIDTLTCIQYSTILAKVLKRQGYEIAETGTIDIGVQHRFTTLKGKDGLTHIISDGQIYSGKNFNQAYTNYQSKAESITFQSDIFDSNNKYLGSYQTETMKYLGDIVSANGSLNSQNLSKDISNNGIDTKNRLDIEIGNMNKKLGIVSINEDGKGYNASFSQKDFGNEGTTVTSSQAGLIQTFDTGDNSNIKFSEQISLSNTKFNNGNSVNTAGLSVEATSYNGFNQDKNGNIIKNGAYGNISTSTSLNVLGIVNNTGNRVPVSNVEITSGATGKIGYKTNKLNVYTTASVSGQLQNISSTANTGDGKLKIDGYSLGAGAEYITSKGTIGANIDYDTFRGNNKKTIGGSFENKKFKIGLSNTETSYDFKITEKKASNKLNLGYKTGNLDLGGIKLEDGIIFVEAEKNKIGGQKNNDKIKIGFNFKF